MKNSKIIIGIILFIALNSSSVNAEWKQNNKGWKFKEDSTYATGWRVIDNKWYYFKNNGYMVTGWIKLNEKWYYLKNDGSMAKGWQKINDSWYYLFSNGEMAKGWVKLDSKWYYFNSNGSMIHDTWKDGIYYLGSNGNMIETEEFKHSFNESNMYGGEINERIIVAKIDENTISVTYIYSGYNEGVSYRGILSKVNVNTYYGELKYPYSNLGYSQECTLRFIDNKVQIIKSPIGITDGKIAEKVK